MKAIRYLTYFLVIIIQLTLIGDELEPDLTIMVPMRDGVELPTDLYLPTPSARGLPCILLRSPAGRNSHWKAFGAMAKLGYVVAIQDTRSIIDTSGKTVPYLADGWGKLQDGYDTVEWLAKSPYTNGKVGTCGSSAVGITQLMLAPSAPPSLKCQYISVAASSLYHHGLFPGGQLLKNQTEGWLGLYACDKSVLTFVANQPFYNDFWKQLDSRAVAHKVRVPAIHYGGWYDTFIQGTIDSFVAWQENGGEGARGTQKLVLGPWSHWWPNSIRFGDFEVPLEGRNPPIDISAQRWFEYYLKGIDNGVDKIPPVIYYVMGPFNGEPSTGNVWRTAEKWPVPAESTPFYLTKQGQLQKTIPEEEGSLSYRYDPQDHIPTLGGCNLFLEAGPKDQRPIESRKDIVLFTTDVLEHDVEVTGPLSAKLYVSSDQLDTDIMVRLSDVYPDGRSILIADGAYRLGVMNVDRSKKVKEKNQPIEINVDLWSTSMVFAKGHRIRVSVSSSNYPRFEKNLNIGLIDASPGRYEIARNILYFGKNYPSQIILPLGSVQQ
jgi:uncharacterized protein